eukprot:1282493-Rhodomonas_salina.1
MESSRDGERKWDGVGEGGKLRAMESSRMTGRERSGWSRYGRERGRGMESLRAGEREMDGVIQEERGRVGVVEGK